MIHTFAGGVPTTGQAVSTAISSSSARDTGTTTANIASVASGIASVASSVATHLRSTGGGATTTAGGHTTTTTAGIALVLSNIEHVTVLGLLATVGGGNVVDFVELQSWATFDAGGKIAGYTTTTTAGIAPG